MVATHRSTHPLSLRSGLSGLRHHRVTPTVLVTAFGLVTLAAATTHVRLLLWVGAAIGAAVVALELRDIART